VSSNATAPDVSVILPTFNRALLLRRAIESVLSQLHVNLELIVVDDCAQDETPAVMELYQGPRVRYFRQKQNVGVYHNWGTGLALSRAEFVCFLMDDDYYEQDFLVSRLNVMKSDQGVDVVFSGYRLTDEQGALHDVVRPVLFHGHRLKGKEFVSAALARFVFIGAAMYRSRTVRDVWPLIQSDNYIIDYALNLQIAMRGGAALYIDRMDFFVQQHRGQISSKNWEEVFSETALLLRRLLHGDAYKHLIRRELASWYLFGARRAWLSGKSRATLQRFRRCVMVNPFNFVAWKWLASLMLRGKR